MVMACVFVKQLVEHVLENPKHYPGPHNVSQPRTSQGLAALDTTRQLLLIWEAMSNHLRENLEAGRSVNVPNFGTFTFEPLVLEDDYPRSGRSTPRGGRETPRSGRETPRGGRETPRGGRDSPFSRCETPRGSTKVQLRPCFIVNSALKEALYRYPGKEEIRTGPAGSSVYQQGRKVIFLNDVPIAAGCYYKSDVIKSGLRALFQGAGDLVKRNYNVRLDFNGVSVIVQNRNLHVKFDPAVTQMVQSTTVRQKSQPLSDTWRCAKLSTSMMNFIERPNSPEVVAMRNRTANLSILSLDMNSCVRTAA